MVEMLWSGCEFHLGLGMEGYAEAGGGKHGQVVGAVANGNCLGNVDFFYLGYDFQQFGLAFAVHDITYERPVRWPFSISSSLAYT